MNKNNDDFIECYNSFDGVDIKDKRTLLETDTIFVSPELWKDLLTYSSEFSDSDMITFHFWEADGYVCYRERAYVKIRNGKEHKACDLMVGDIIKDSKGEWNKIIKIEK